METVLVAYFVEYQDQLGRLDVDCIQGIYVDLYFA